MAEYRLSPAAESDMEGIWRYTHRQWGIEQAQRYTDTLTAAFQELAVAPEAAPACDTIRRGYRRRRIPRHIVYFRRADYGIEIVRVLHDRMDATQRL
jgi:toxin ParE1/3/4